MRVVAGSAGGMSLFSPRGEVRPTMDRVKAAIFSMLGERVPGARVLDLFAGSGGLGIEALSRGCASVTFVEKEAAAIDVIRRNLQKTRLTGVIRQSDAFFFLKKAAPGSFDIAFADPPYAKTPGERDFGAELVRFAPLRRALADDGIFVLEKLPGKPLPAQELWRPLRERRYGNTEVVIFAAAGEQP